MWDCAAAPGGGRGRALAEERRPRRGGEARGDRGREGISPACAGRERGFVKESGAHARMEGRRDARLPRGSAVMQDCVAAPGEREGGRLPRRGDRGKEGRRGEIAVGISPACARWRAGAAGAGRGRAGGGIGMAAGAAGARRESRAEESGRRRGIARWQNRALCTPTLNT
jgi:hypothetical protein